MNEHEFAQVRDRGLRNEWRLDSLDRWRKEHVDPCVQKVTEMAQADEIAVAVAKKMREHDRFSLTRRQKIYAGVYGISVAVIPTLLAHLLHVPK